MNDLTVSGAKALARGMVARMGALGVPMSLAHALEAVASTHQYSDWNRFRSALKRRKVEGLSSGEVKHPPHRLIVSYPGFGAGAVLEHGFAWEATQDNHFPVLIRISGGYDNNYMDNVIASRLNVAVVNGYFQEDADPQIVFDGLPSEDSSGLIIRLWAEHPDSMPQKRLGAQQLRPAWLACAKSFLGIFHPAQLEKDGSLFLWDYDYADKTGVNDYDVLLPELMRRLRVSGAKKSLVVSTQNDQSRASLYRSPDAWRLIMMVGNNTTLFPHCPFERLITHQASPLVPTYFVRLFSDPERYLEDAALFFGSTSCNITQIPLPVANAYGQLAIDNWKAAIEWQKSRSNH